MKNTLLALLIVVLILAAAWLAWRQGLFARVGLAPGPPPPGPSPREYGPAAPGGGQGFSSATGALYGTTYGVVCTGLTGGQGGQLCGAAVQAGNVVGTTIQKGAEKVWNTVKGWF